MEFKKLYDLEVKLKNLNKEKKRIESIITPTNITPQLFKYILQLFDTIKKIEQEFDNYLNQLNKNNIHPINTNKILQHIYNSDYSYYYDYMRHRDDIMIGVHALTHLKYSLSN